MERYVNVLGIGHISARDTLHLIAQYMLSKRNQNAYSFAVTPRVQTDALSLVYAHKRGLGREFNLGVTQTNTRTIGEAKRSTTEVFAKMSWALSL